MIEEAKMSGAGGRVLDISGVAGGTPASVAS